MHVILVGHDHPKVAFIRFIIALSLFNYLKTVTNLISIGYLLEGHLSIWCMFRYMIIVKRRSRQKKGVTPMSISSVFPLNDHGNAGKMIKLN